MIFKTLEYDLKHPWVNPRLKLLKKITISPGARNRVLVEKSVIFDTIHASDLRSRLFTQSYAQRHFSFPLRFLPSSLSARSWNLFMKENALEATLLAFQVLTSFPDLTWPDLTFPGMNFRSTLLTRAQWFRIRLTSGHSFTCSALLSSPARSLARSLTRSWAPGTEQYFCLACGFFYTRVQWCQDRTFSAPP